MGIFWWNWNWKLLFLYANPLDDLREKENLWFRSKVLILNTINNMKMIIFTVWIKLELRDELVLSTNYYQVLFPSGANDWKLRSMWLLYNFNTIEYVRENMDSLKLHKFKSVLIGYLAQTDCLELNFLAVASKSMKP